MDIIKKYDQPEVVPHSTLLTQQQALNAFNLFIQGKNEVEVRHELLLPLNKLKSLYVKLYMVRDMIERIVKGEAKIQFEEGHYVTDPETGEQSYVIDTPVEYAAIPETLEELKQIALQVIENDDSVDISIFDGDIYSLITGLNYVIDKIIECSNQTNNADFLWWKQQVIENQ